jgi:mannose/cellobiose epimerase-like protein (N-acyl-D-glucosamine 2-epimerase family)
MEDSLQAFPAFAFSTLLPLCRDHYADSVYGGFHEQLTPDFMPVPGIGKRLLVQCRQLYVLSHAAVLGDRSGTLAAEAGYDFLRRAYQDRQHGGWFFRTTIDGTPTDRGKDLYGHAFVLLAMAWMHRAFGAPGALELAASTMDVLKDRMASPHGGFYDCTDETWVPISRPQRQNPHMHLLEALLDLHEATGEVRWLDEAIPLLHLFRTRFIDPATGTLGEYFTEDWQQHPEHGAIVEPGHHFEWFWLLHRHMSLGASVSTVEMQAARQEHIDIADSLFTFAKHHGFDPQYGGIHDQVDRVGRPIRLTRRIGTMTEAIKAASTRVISHRPDVISSQRDEELEEVSHLIQCLFTNFVQPTQQAGLYRGWHETLSREGKPSARILPGTTPYHLFLAAAEVRRMLRQLA